MRISDWSSDVCSSDLVAAREQIEAVYDARFYRMWCFYLASAITAFRHSDHCNFQIQLARQRDALPITRRYLEQTEDRYRALDAAPRAQAAEQRALDAALAAPDRGPQGCQKLPATHRILAETAQPPTSHKSK